jgi:hypothetical protein
MMSKKVLVQEMRKLSLNRHFKYFVYFLSAVNLFGYLANRKLNAMIFFGLVAAIASRFTDNVVLVLVAALVSTSLIVTTKVIKEGMEDAASTTTSEEDAGKKPSTEEVLAKIAVAHPNLSVAADDLNTTGDVEQTKANLQQKKADKKAEVSAKITDPNNPNMNAVVDDDAAVEAFGNTIAAPKKAGPRIDYTSTMNEAYTNLNTLLGSDGINSLTKDTKELMGQQQKLFDTMQNMVPALNSAQEMMGKFDINKLMSTFNKAK